MLKPKTCKTKIKFIAPILGSAPPTPDIYERYLRKKLEKEIEKIEKRLQKKPDPVLQEKLESLREEYERIPVLAEIEPHEEKLTVFYRDENNYPVIRAHQVLGFLKEVGNAFKDKIGIKNLRQKINYYVAVRPIEIPLFRDEDLTERITKPDGLFERPLRAQTLQGPRSSIAKSEKLNPLVYAQFEIHILPNKQGVNEKLIKQLLDLGVYRGISQWSNSNYYGTFEVVEFKCE